MECGVLSSQMREVERAISALRPYLYIPGISDAQRQLYALRAELLSNIGMKLPRKTSAILKLMGLSPGSLNLFHDLEGGWLVAAKSSDGAVPVYHYVSDKVAITLMSVGLTHELESELMKPDEYIGE